MGGKVIYMFMIAEGSSCIGYLTTSGRVSGTPHTIPLRLVYYQGKLYASGRDARSDWCRNLIHDPKVTVEVQGERWGGIARLVTDQALCRKISQLKYGGQRASERRTVIEIALVTASPG